MPIVPASGGKCRRLAISWKPAWSIQYISGQPGNIARPGLKTKTKKDASKFFYSPLEGYLKKKKRLEGLTILR